MNYSFKTALNKSDRGGWVRLLTLTYLRWMQLLVKLLQSYCFYFLKLDFLIFSCLYLILLSSILNLLCWFFFPKTKRLTNFKTCFYYYMISAIGFNALFYRWVVQSFCCFHIRTSNYFGHCFKFKIYNCSWNVAIVVVTILSFFFQPIIN